MEIIAIIFNFMFSFLHNMILLVAYKSYRYIYIYIVSKTSYTLFLTFLAYDIKYLGIILNL